ncbi:MAG: glucosamine-6-phosphate deaminase [Clostridiales bacterium]|nr:glucosamine-6-phosphate deaminase [Clostridiales bacterium]
MRIIRAKDYKDMSEKAASIIWAQMLLKKNSVLGLATGGTVLGIYEILCEKYMEGELDFSSVKTLNLDEYVGLEGRHPQSYRHYMDKNLFEKVNILKNNTFLPNGLAEDLKRECKDYDETIRQLGPIDLQLLGLGRNGHIGFNEPDDHFEDNTHVRRLNETTIKDNSRFFEMGEEVPKSAITMGIKPIMESKAVLLAVSGVEKAKALKAVLNGPVTPSVPGSILGKHENLIVVADLDALMHVG